MSDSPGPPDPFGDLPPELRRMLEQFGATDPAALFQRLPGMLGAQTSGPVNWDLAGRVARQLAADGDRAPTDAERERHEEALELAEHWLDGSSLPAPPDAGRLRVASRQEWVDAALTEMRPLIEPVAAASTRALADATQSELGDANLEQMGLGALGAMLGDLDLGELLRPVGAMMTGMQAGQVLGQLSQQLLGQYELGLPTAPRTTAFAIAVNIEDAFGEWDLEPTEVAVTLALHEAAHRRLFHAVPWLEAHVHGLIAQFANGTEIDPDQLRRMSEELMLGVDPEDPESLQEAMSKAANFRLEPTPQQRRVLERIQGVVSLVGAWARHEVARAAGERLPNLERVAEILRRRRATKGDGEQLLEQLLGLDLRPDDEEVGERFVESVEQAKGPETLRRALAHPENLPDAAELAEPSKWLDRMGAGDEVPGEPPEGGEIPDDASALFGDLGEAPVERSAEERLQDRDDPDEGAQSDGI